MRVDRLGFLIAGPFGGSPKPVMATIALSLSTALAGHWRWGLPERAFAGESARRGHRLKLGLRGGSSPEGVPPSRPFRVGGPEAIMGPGRPWSDQARNLD